MPTESWQESRHIEFMLRECQTWAIVGLGGNPARVAYRIAAFLQQRGKRIVPIHPEGNHVLGEDGYPSLSEVPFDVDCVDVFRRAGAAGEFVDQAVHIGARGIWFQVGVIDEQAFGRAVEAGVPMVMDVCPAIEWPEHGPAG